MISFQKATTDPDFCEDHRSYQSVKTNHVYPVNSNQWGITGKGHIHLQWDINAEVPEFDEAPEEAKFDVYLGSVFFEPLHEFEDLRRFLEICEDWR